MDIIHRVNFSFRLHFSAVTETKEGVCVSPITVFIKQIGNDFWWFTPQPKASIAILKLFKTLLFICLLPLFLSAHTPIHPHLLIDFAHPRLSLSLLLSSAYLRDTRFLLFNVVFAKLISPAVSRSLSAPFCSSRSMPMSAAVGNSGT